MSKKLCTVGLISWCDINKYPKRFEVFKQCLSAFHKYIPRDICETVIVDNGSSDEVVDYIKKNEFFDKRIILKKNIQDIGAYAVLGKVCEDNKTEYFLPIENDYVFFRGDFIKPCIDMLRRTPRSGYVRLLKFEHSNIDKYDKEKNLKLKRYNPNAVRMLNYISGEKLFWAGPIVDDLQNTFFINNWHWQTFGSLISIKLWNKIFVNLSGKVPAYQHAELAMMEKFQKLNLQTLVLDGGAFNHQDPTSMYRSSKKRRIFVSASDIKYFVNNYKKHIV